MIWRSGPGQRRCAPGQRRRPGWRRGGRPGAGSAGREIGYRLRACTVVIRHPACCGKVSRKDLCLCLAIAGQGPWRRV